MKVIYDNQGRPERIIADEGCYLTERENPLPDESQRNFWLGITYSEHNLATLTDWTQAQRDQWEQDHLPEPDNSEQVTENNGDADMTDEQLEELRYGGFAADYA